MVPNTSAEALHPYTCAGCNQEFSTEEELNHHNKAHAGNSVSLPGSAERLSHIPDEDLKIGKLMQRADA
jgi:hypothetical protein